MDQILDTLVCSLHLAIMSEKANISDLCVLFSNVCIEYNGIGSVNCLNILSIFMSEIEFENMDKNIRYDFIRLHDDNL